MKHDTAGDPTTGLKWTRKTTRKIAAELRTLGIQVSRNTVGKLLKELGYRLRANEKKISSGSRAQRDQQFTCLGGLRERFANEGLPIVSVDTKKKELVGLFKNPGTVWSREPVRVNDHDFRSAAHGIAVPYGVYDVEANRGSIFVGRSHDTPQFAVECIAAWWRYDGRTRYPQAGELLILADGGGSNGPNPRAWKYHLQHDLSNRYGISVTVSHYPPGASKWNPIEHRLFSEVSKNWAATPLDSWETIVQYIRTTKTSTGLTVKAYLVRKNYAKGVKISDEKMTRLCIQKHQTLPRWNYTFAPNKNKNGK